MDRQISFGLLLVAAVIMTPVLPRAVGAQVPTVDPRSASLEAARDRVEITLQGRNLGDFTGARVVAVNGRGTEGIAVSLGRASRTTRTLTVETSGASAGLYAVDLVSRSGTVRLGFELTVEADAGPRILDVDAPATVVLGSAFNIVVSAEDPVGLGRVVAEVGRSEVARAVRGTRVREPLEIGGIAQGGTVAVNVYAEDTRGNRSEPHVVEVTVEAPIIMTVYVPPEVFEGVEIFTEGVMRGGTVSGEVRFGSPAMTDRTVEVVAGPSAYRPVVFSESVTVPAGDVRADLSAELSISMPIGDGEVVPVTATYVADESGEEFTANTTLTLIPDPKVASVVVDPVNALFGGDEATLQINLERPAPPGGETLTLEPSDAAVLAEVPLTLEVPEGQTSVSFTFTPVSPGYDKNVGINVRNHFGGGAQGRWFIVHPKPAIDQLVPMTPTPVRYPQVVQFRLLLEDETPRAIQVALTSDRPDILPVPATVDVWAERDEWSFGAQTTGPTTAETVSVTVTASYGATSAEATYLVHPTLPFVSGVELASPRQQFYPGDFVSIRYMLGAFSNPLPSGHEVETMASDPVLVPYPTPPTSSPLSYGYAQWQVGDFDEPREVEVTASAGGGSASLMVPLVMPTLESLRLEDSGQEVTEAEPGTWLICRPEFHLPLEVVGPGFEVEGTVSSDRPDLIEPVTDIEFPFRAQDVSQAFQCRVAPDAEVTEPTPVTVSVTFRGETRSATVMVVPAGG